MSVLCAGKKEYENKLTGEQKKTKKKTRRVECFILLISCEAAVKLPPTRLLLSFHTYSRSKVAI